MLLFRPGQRVALSLALVCSLTPVALASNLLKKGHGDCCDTTVKLPGHRVVVHTSAPRVTVQEAKVTRGDAVCAIGTVYMPMAMPAGVPQRDPDASQVDVNPLRSVHTAELARLQYHRACVLAKADLEAALRAYDRTCGGGEAPPPAPPTDAAARVKELSAKVEKLLDRISAVEKLKIIHDNYLKEHVQQNMPTTTK